MVIGIGAIAAIQGAVNATIAAQNARKKIEEEKQKEKESDYKNKKRIDEEARKRKEYEERQEYERLKKKYGDNK